MKVCYSQTKTLTISFPNYYPCPNHPIVGSWTPAEGSYLPADLEVLQVWEIRIQEYSGRPLCYLRNCS